MTPDPTSAFTLAIGNELRHLRRRAGLTQRDAATRLRSITGMPVNTSSLCRWERGQQQLPLDKLITICQAYGTYTPHLIDAALRRALPEHWEACAQQRQPITIRQIELPHREQSARNERKTS